jgi:uncharacterized protein YlxW (UPF0749 family)
VNDGTRLTYRYNDLMIGIMTKNGFFKHKQIHWSTQIQPNRNLKSIIDYIITRQSNNIKINDVRMLRGTMCQLNH